MLFKVFAVFNIKSNERESKWRDQLYSIPEKNKFRILVHSSSMGEFEQAKPIIEVIRKNLPDCEIIASFFSPSGYENQKKYSGIDYSLYLPIDTELNSIEFTQRIKPDIAIFVRYDLWLNILINLNKLGCNNYLVCAAKPSDNWFSRKKFVKSYLAMCYNYFNHIFTVDEIQTQYLKSLDVKSKITTMSDTRSDRILNLVNNSKINKLIPGDLLDNSFNLVAGSSWQKDEEIISVAVNSINKDSFKIRVIYTPHEPTESNISRIQSLHKKSILLSEILSKSGIVDSEILKESHIIVDGIGYLLRLYSNADFAYVGCGFGDGVHSVSEPAGYGIPIACGPNIHKMPDAVELDKLKSLKIINNSDELENWLIELMNNPEMIAEIGEINKNYIESASGSSKKITEIILNNHLN
jgi:3-deoxy-D-manno-octulosonic-acid transferase